MTDKNLLIEYFMVIIFLGPPGSGKGTHAALLSQRHHFLHMSTGDLFRQEVLKGTALGKEIEKFLTAGELVPDSIVLKVMRSYIRENEQCGFVFDGFPRTKEQAEGLDEILREVNKVVSYVFLLELSEQEIIRRALTRRVCSNCGEIYNVEFKPTRIPGRCDVCGGEVSEREDDKEETIRKRLKVYHEAIKPIVDFYEKRCCLYRLDGELGKDEVQKKIEEIIAQDKVCS